MRSIIISLLSLAVLAALPACKGKQNDPAETREPAASSGSIVVLSAEQARLAQIQTGTAEMRTLELAITCTGMVDVPPQNVIAVHAPVKGIVRNVTQLPGTFLRKGQLLTSLSHPDLVRLQREFLENQSQLDMLEKEFKRKQALASNEATSQRALEQAKAEYELARARSQGLKAELKLVGIDVANLESTQHIQEQITLYSPVSGYVDQVNINPGKLVNAEDLLYTILDVSHVHAELNVFARDIPRLKEGQRIEVRVPGNDKAYPAEVHLLSRMVNPDDKTIRVHGHFSPEPKDLFPGSFLQAKIFTENSRQPCVPETALIREGDASFVFVKKGEGFEKTPVRTVGNDGKYVALLDLPTGAVVALTGAYYLNGVLAGGEEE